MRKFGERLRDAMACSGKRVPHVMAEMHVSKQTVYSWLKMDDAGLSGLHLVDLSICLGVRAYWLAKGVGPMYPRFNREQSIVKEA